MRLVPYNDSTQNDSTSGSGKVAMGVHYDSQVTLGVCDGLSDWSTSLEIVLQAFISFAIQLPKA